MDGTRETHKHGFHGVKREDESVLVDAKTNHSPEYRING